MLHRDVEYLGPDRAEKLDLYLPDNAGQSLRPAVVIIHGGGWRVGDKADFRETQIAETLTTAGYVCVSINYTLFTDKKPAWPAYLNEAREAVAFLRRNAAEYRIDPSRIGAIGSSAGGNIALLLGSRVEDYEPVRAVVALYPPTDMTLKGFGRLPIFGPELLTNPEMAVEASPVFLVTDSFPPTLLLHGTEDKLVTLDHSTNMAAALKKFGVPHRLKVIEGAPHTFKIFEPGWDLRGEVVGFFDQFLKA